MECPKCGSMIDRSEIYCPVCGEKIERSNEVRENKDDFFKGYGDKYKNEKPKDDNFVLHDMPSMKYNVYAIIGFVLSLLGLICCMAPIADLFLLLPGILLSLFGLKAYTKKHFAIVGLFLGVIGLVINIILTIYMMGAFASLA